MFLGDELEAVVKSIVEDKDYATPGKVPMHLGVDVLPEFKKDTTDRNRTSPFAFTGNRFEFRMLGSAVNIACPNIMINTIMAEELNQFCDEIEKADNKDKAIKELIKRHLQTIRELSLMVTVILMNGLLKLKREVYQTTVHFLKHLLTLMIRRTLTYLLRTMFMMKLKSRLER